MHQPVSEQKFSRLSSLTVEMKDIALMDGKKIICKARLTEPLMKELQLDYGSDIRENKGQLAERKDAVWAI